MKLVYPRARWHSEVSRAPRGRGLTHSHGVSWRRRTPPKAGQHLASTRSSRERVEYGQFLIRFARIVVSSARKVIQAGGPDALLTRSNRPGGIRYSSARQLGASVSDRMYQYGPTEADSGLRTPFPIDSSRFAHLHTGRRRAGKVRAAVRASIPSGISATEGRICS